MRRGLSNKEIARQLSISPGTVKVHLNSVYRAVGVHNRIAALVALQRSDVYVEPAASTEARQSSSRTQLEAA
jgi:DNA-binding NarL/FixJ family response regulator